MRTVIAIVKGRKVTAFTDSEEEAVGLVEAVPDGLSADNDTALGQ